MVNKHTVDYQPSSSQLVSRIHPLVFLWTPKAFIFPESFLNFFLNLYVPPWLLKSFKLTVLRLLANIFVCQKVEFVHFYSCPQAKLSPSVSPEQRLLKIYFSPAGERIVEFSKNYQKLPKNTKIKLTRVLVTSFDKFHYLCSLQIVGFCFVVS